MTINETQDKIIAEFFKFQEWFDKYAYLIKLGKKLESLDNKLIIDTAITLRERSRNNKDWATSDHMRDVLSSYGIVVEDSDQGTSWPSMFKVVWWPTPVIKTESPFLAILIAFLIASPRAGTFQ